MPFLSATDGSFGYGRQQQIISSNPSGLPTYYTINSYYAMVQPSYNTTNLNIQALSSIGTTTYIRTYSPMSATGWNYIHDKDLDSNVWYGMVAGTGVLSKNTLTKGGTTVTTSTIFTVSGSGAQFLGACYAPACMATSSNYYGAFVTGGYTTSNIYILPFTSLKTVVSSYSVKFQNEVYGVEMIPKQASGFNNHYGVAYTRANHFIGSWTVSMSPNSAGTWTNVVSTIYTAGTNGPSNGDGMIYYPPGKYMYIGDPYTAFNRIGMNDTSSARLYTYKITESGTSTVWTYLSTITIATASEYPYHMSINTYNSIS
jgi:hypothetical protein